MTLTSQAEQGRRNTAFDTLLIYPDGDFEYITKSQKRLLNEIISILRGSHRLRIKDIKKALRERTGQRPNNSTLSSMIRILKMASCNLVQIKHQGKLWIAPKIGMYCRQTRQPKSPKNKFSSIKEVYLKKH